MKKLDFLLIKKAVLVLAIAATSYANLLLCGDLDVAPSAPTYPASQTSGPPALLNQSGFDFCPAPKYHVDGAGEQPAALHMPDDQPQIPYERDDGSWLIPEQVIAGIVFYPDAIGSEQIAETEFNIHKKWQGVLACGQEEFEEQKQLLATQVQSLFDARAMGDLETQYKASFLTPDPAATGWRWLAQATAAAMQNSWQTLKQFSTHSQDPVFGPQVEQFLQNATNTNLSITICSQDNPENCIENVKPSANVLLRAIGVIWSKAIISKSSTDSDIELPGISLEQWLFPKCTAPKHKKHLSPEFGVVSCQCKEPFGLNVKFVTTGDSTNWPQEIKYLTKKLRENNWYPSNIAVTIESNGQVTYTIEPLFDYEIKKQTQREAQRLPFNPCNPDLTIFDLLHNQEAFLLINNNQIIHLIQTKDTVFIQMIDTSLFEQHALKAYNRYKRHSTMTSCKPQYNLIHAEELITRKFFDETIAPFNQPKKAVKLSTSSPEKPYIKNPKLSSFASHGIISRININIMDLVTPVLPQILLQQKHLNGSSLVLANLQGLPVETILKLQYIIAHEMGHLISFRTHRYYDIKVDKQSQNQQALHEFNKFIAQHQCEKYETHQTEFLCVDHKTQEKVLELNQELTADIYSAVNLIIIFDENDQQKLILGIPNIRLGCTENDYTLIQSALRQNAKTTGDFFRIHPARKIRALYMLKAALAVQHSRKLIRSLTQ
jgi:hypothetical protein